MFKVGDMTKRYLSRFIKTDEFGGTIDVIDVKDDRVAILYAGQKRWLWILPDGSASIFSTHPRQFYKQTLDGYVPAKKGHTVSGKFPMFHIDGTKHVGWLDYDGSLKLYPVDFVARCDAFVRLQRDKTVVGFKDDPRSRLGKRDPNKPRFMVRAYRDWWIWSVWLRGKELHSAVCDVDKTQAMRDAKKWFKRYLAQQSKTG